MKKTVACAILLLLILPLSGQAQSASSFHWSTTDGDQYLEVTGDGLHLKPRTQGTGPGNVNATSKLTVPDTQNWQVSFDIRFGVLRDQASSFHLSRAGQDLGWVSADGFFKQMGVFIGKNTEVAAPAADTEWHHFSYVSNGSTLNVSLDGRQVGSGAAQNVPDCLTLSNGQDMRVPCHQEGVWIRNVSVNAETQAVVPHPSEAAPPVFSPASHELGVVGVQEGDGAVACVLGDTVRLNGNTSGHHRLSRRSLEINDQPYTDLVAQPNEDGYSFDWKPTSPGIYKLAVKFALQKPYEVIVAKSATVIVLAKAPLALQQFSKPVPANCPVAVQAINGMLFHPARVEFFLNDQSVGVAQQEPFQVTLPISKQTPGSYVVSYKAYDAQGARYNGETETVNVPLRVRVTMPSDIKLVAANETTAFKSDIVPDMKIVRVDYSVDDQKIASATAAPYDATADLSTFKTGQHSVKSDVVVEDGATFSAAPVTFNLTNQPDDARIAKLAKDQADEQTRLQKEEDEKKAQLAKQMASSDAAKAEKEKINKEDEADFACFWPRPGFDEQEFRKLTAELASRVPEKRTGHIGRVHGLSVLRETISDGVTETTVSQTGQALTVSATVRPGTGQTNFLAFSKEDAEVTAKQASEYCKTRTAYFHWDWSKYDVTVGYLQNDVINSGPSAGVADALAIMSAVLNTPVDDSVAVTGAITLQGQVEAVGGVDMKAEAAFADTDAHTLLVPNDIVSSAALTEFYETHPALCFSRRVIFLNNMDEAMEQALIGWNTDKEVREEKLVQGGLRHFARGEDKLALAAFAAAKQLTPGNWTADFFVALLDAVEKQHIEDAAVTNGK